jgi:hypothetical protein
MEELVESSAKTPIGSIASLDASEAIEAVLTTCCDDARTTARLSLRKVDKPCGTKRL